MSDSNKRSLFQGSIFGYTWKSRGVVFSTTVACVAVFGFVGYFLGKQLGGNVKLITILAIAVSFPVAQIMIYRILKRNNYE